jgi:hypothetical protein
VEPDEERFDELVERLALALFLFAPDVLAEAFFAVGFFAVGFFAEVRFFDAETFAAGLEDAFAGPRLAAEATLLATFGAPSLIALPIWGARFATWSPAARTALPTAGGVFDATFLATFGAPVRTAFAISGALSATALPIAGAFCAISATRSPITSAAFDLPLMASA